MIGITFALPSESSDLVRQLQGKQRRGDLITGKIDNHEVAIVHTGVGAKNCNSRLEALIHTTRPKFIISAGFAGAISDELKVGDLVLAENFSDTNLLDLAKEILRDQNTRPVKFFTSTSIIDSIEERNEIARKSGAAAVDMETGSIVAVCNAHGMPLLSLRGISDSPREPFPVPMSILFDIEQQRPNYRELCAYLLEEPPALLRLFRFARNIKRVRAKLTKAIVELVRQL